MRDSAGKTPSTRNVNVLRWWFYRRQSKTKKLEPVVCRVLQHIGVDITEERIEACDRLNKQTDRNIVKRRKDCEHIMRKKSELRKLKPSELDLPNGTKL